MPFSAKLVESNPKLFRYEWIWDKKRATGFLNANKMPMKRHENILIFYKHLPIYNPQYTEGKPYIRGVRSATTNYGKFNTNYVTKNEGTRCPIDILEFYPQTGFHPTQKPVALCEYLIKTYTNEGDLVLDNCMGSGTTGVACINTNRNFIGIELNKEYFEIAQKRINESQKYEQIKIKE